MYSNQIESIMKQHTLRKLYQPYKWLVFGPFFIFLTFFLGGAAVILSFIFGPKIANYCGVIWAFLNAKLTPVFVKISGKENIDKEQSYVVVSNHLSHYDIFLLYGWLGIDFRWVMKKELRNLPVFGVACEKMGHIFIDRSDTKKAISSINNAKKKIADGTSVLFFPEGTRSPNGNLGVFKKGAFKLALDLGIPILPVTVSGTNKILPPGTLDLLPGQASMVIHPPININDFNDENIYTLIKKTECIISQGKK